MRRHISYSICVYMRRHISYSICVYMRRHISYSICVDIYPTVYAYICVHIYPTKQAYMRQHISYCICVELILVYNGCLFSRLLCGERGRRYLPVNYSWKKRDKKVGKWNAGTFLKLLKQMLSLWYNFFLKIKWCFCQTGLFRNRIRKGTQINLMQYLWCN